MKLILSTIRSSQIMKHTISNFTVLIEQDEDGIYVARVPDISGCYTTQGKTVGQAMARMREVIKVCLRADNHICVHLD